MSRIEGNPTASLIPVDQTGAESTNGSTPIRPSSSASPSNSVVQYAGGSVGAPAYADADATYAEVKKLLSLGVFDWRVSDRELAEVHVLLSRLSNEDYAKALDRLSRDGLLERYFSKMSDGARQAFLQQAERKEVIAREEGKKAEIAVGNPPDGPALYRLDRPMPEALRQLVHAENKRAAFAYEKEYLAYLERYQAHVMAAKDGFELLAMGEPVDHIRLYPRGLETDPDLQRDWGLSTKQRDLRNKAYQAVMNRMYDLTGQQRPGTFWFKAKADIEAFKSIKYSREVTVTDYGAVKESWAASAKAKLPDGTSYELTRSQGGKWKASVGIDTEAGGLKVDSNGSIEQVLKVGGGSVKLDNKGSMRMELEASPAWSSYAEVDARRGTFEQGVKLGVSTDQLKVSISAGVGFQGSRAESVPYIVADEHFFAAAVALHEGKKWNELSETLQGQLKRANIDEEKWNALQSRRAGT